MKLPLKNNKVLSLILVYRPHKLYNGDQVIQNNELLCELLSKSERPAVIVGDFNYPDIDWINMTARNEQSKKLVNVIGDNFYNQHVEFPTHVSGSLIDIVLSSEQNLIVETKDLGRIGASDHNAILCQIQSNIKMNKKSKTIENWNKANLEQMNIEINSVDWNESFSYLSTEQCWNKLTNFLDQLQENHVPKKLNKKALNLPG